MSDYILNNVVADVARLLVISNKLRIIEIQSKAKSINFEELDSLKSEIEEIEGSL